MGSYATTTSLQTIMIGTSFDTATTALASKTIDQVESMVDGMLAKRYDVSNWTTGSVPPLVITWTEIISSAYMYRYMSRGSKDAYTRASELEKYAISQIEDVVKGNTNLADTSGSLIPDSSLGAWYMKSTTEDYANVFNLDDQINWGVSENQLNDIEDERDDV